MKVGEALGIAAVAGGLFLAAPPIGAAAPERTTIAVLPIENLSGAGAPLSEIRAALRAGLEGRGLSLLDDAALEAFMRRHRLRYVGGLGRDTARSLLGETGAGAALVTSVDLYTEADPPRLGLTSRLVSTDGEPRILWMDSAGVAGDEAPGFLGRGLVRDPGIVRRRVVERLVDSLAGGLGGTRVGPRRAAAEDRGPRRFRPRSAYRSALTPRADGRPPRIAVLPFANESGTRHAGTIVSLQIIRSLADASGIDVLEPGLLRDVLLNARLIQQEGPSSPQADLLRTLLDVDVVVSGEVSDYADTGPGAEAPEIGFSARAVDTATRQVICVSVSHARGDDGVFFFDVGRVPTAQDLASRMGRGLVAAVLPALRGGA